MAEAAEDQAVQLNKVVRLNQTQVHGDHQHRLEAHSHADQSQKGHSKQDQKTTRTPLYMATLDLLNYRVNSIR
mgnify:CR=1 FL=1